MISLPDLQHFLEKGIIQVKQKENTLFDIAGFPHYENVVSNVYAYFFNPANDHGFGTLFIDSLQELISTNFDFTSPKIMRECYSDKGGRIDLVIEDSNGTKTEGKSESHGSVILIENKIYHDLNNDFEDYYNSFTAKRKQGVLLTIRPVMPSHPGFANVTHDQLINNVFKNIGDRVLKAQYRSIFALNEFSRNLKNFTMEHEVRHYFQFYSKNRETIQQVEKLKAELIRHIWEQIEAVPELLAGMNLTLASRYSSSWRCYVPRGIDQFYFVVAPKILDSEKPEITIVVQLNKGGIERLNDINKIEFTAQERELLDETKILRTGWLHYAKRSFQVNDSDFENLSLFIKEKIESSGLKSVFEKVKDVLTKSEL